MCLAAGCRGERLPADLTGTLVFVSDRAGSDNLWIADGTLLRRVSRGALVTVTVSGDRWGTADAASWPPAGTPANDAYAVAAHGGEVFVVGSKALTGSLATSSSALRIGGNSAWGEYFSGLIDEVRVYNRALSAGEIATDLATAIP